jgi:hypothetical protein
MPIMKSTIYSYIALVFEWLRTWGSHLKWPKFKALPYWEVIDAPTLKQKDGHNCGPLTIAYITVRQSAST